MTSTLNISKSNRASSAADSERRLEKLAKINTALMRRVERSMGHAENAFSLFQTAIALDGEVRARTEELKATLEQLERSNLELTAARDLAERANQNKTGFFTAVGHDVLQPLQAARLTLSALAEMEDGQPGQALVFQVEQALSIVEDLLRTILDLSRLETGALRPNIQPVELEDVFKSVVLGLLPLAHAKGIALRFRKTPLWVMSDSLMLRRIVQNLVANAVRYTEIGRVLVNARLKGGEVGIEIWDTGPGIAASERHAIFQEFERGAAAKQTGNLGFGLGLSIVRRMADVLGHAITLRSHEGRGSCFALHAKRASAVTATRVHQSSVRHPQLAARVVVIENDNSVAAAMEALLNQWGCEVRLVRNFSEASALAGEEPPHILLADYHLDNGECGLSSIRLLRNVFGIELPAVVVTADRTAEVAAAVQAADCEMMLKPVKPAEMRSLIAHLVHR